MKRKGNVLLCGVRHLAALRRELAGQGLALRNTRGVTQLQTLVKVLEYLGQRGINTPEGTGLGFYRLATRIGELEEAGYVIASRREAVIGADGLYHVGIARYIMLGRREDGASPQLALNWGIA